MTPSEGVLWFVLGVPLVEVVGYLWHRFVEHGGLLDETLRHKHWVHHEREYPAENVRPNKRDQDAKDWIAGAPWLS